MIDSISASYPDPRGVAVPSTGNKAKVLSSWKEIAAYLSKGVRTVQRWEEQFGLPVSRPTKAQKGFVLASTDKLDRWLAMKWTQQSIEKASPSPADSGDANGLAASIRSYRRTRQENRELMYDLARAMEGLRGESEELAHALSRSAETKNRATDKRKPSGVSSPIRRQGPL
jgi:hypothetical protein